MLYNCTHMATVEVKGLNEFYCIVLDIYALWYVVVLFILVMPIEHNLIHC